MTILTSLLIMFTLNSESYPHDFFTKHEAQLSTVCADASTWTAATEDMCNTFAEWSY